MGVIFTGPADVGNVWTGRAVWPSAEITNAAHAVKTVSIKTFSFSVL